MPEVKDNPREADLPPPPPSEKLQWAFFWALTGITCLIIIGSIVVFLRSGNPWSFALDVFGIPPGTLWVRMAIHLFPVNLKELELEFKREDARRRNNRKST